MRYDGAGRRIVYAVQNQGDLDVTYHAYYDGQSEIEAHNGSDQVLRQYVWGSIGGTSGVTSGGGRYIDELCQVALNQDPWNASAGSPTENDVERFFYALHDANYNVIGITTYAGRLVERYEYTPYGSGRCTPMAG